MIVVSSREFRDNQKKYLDLVDADQQVIIQRGKEKAYVLTSVGEKDRYVLDPETKAEIMEGIAQYKSGDTVALNEEEIKQLLGL